MLERLRARVLVLWPRASAPIRCSRRGRASSPASPEGSPTNPVAKRLLGLGRFEPGVGGALSTVSAICSVGFFACVALSLSHDAAGPSRLPPSPMLMYVGAHLSALTA